jgi:hypothetical protein
MMHDFATSAFPRAGVAFSDIHIALARHTEKRVPRPPPFAGAEQAVECGEPDNLGWNRRSDPGAVPRSSPASLARGYSGDRDDLGGSARSDHRPLADPEPALRDDKPEGQGRGSSVPSRLPAASAARRRKQSFTPRVLNGAITYLG